MSDDSTQKRVEDFLNYLQLKNDVGQTLYGHLAQIIAKLLDDRPANPIQQIKPISLEIKNAAGALQKEADYQQQLSDDEIELITNLLHLYERHCGQLEELSNDSAVKCVKTDVLQLNQQLKQLQLPCFNDLTAKLLQRALDTFCAERSGYFSEVRFFGQFKCVDGQYYVLECMPAKPRAKMYRFQGEQLPEDAQNSKNSCKLLKNTEFDQKIGFLSDRKVRKMQQYLAEHLQEIDEENLQFDLTTINNPPKITKQGYFPSGDGVHVEGVNRYIYFVTKNIQTFEVEWTRLPDVEARQVRISRFITTRLSGDLKQRIFERIPSFPGCEAHYLRCLIARIKHGSALAPSGCVTLPEEPENAELDENAEKQLKNAEYMDPDTANDCFKDDVEADALNALKSKRHYVNWPVIQKESEEIQYEDLLSLDNWVHTCPPLSHHGVVIQVEAPEETGEAEAEADEEEPEEENQEAADDADEKEEEAVEEKHSGEGEEEEEKVEKEPVEKPIDIGPLAQERLKTAYAECDQKRIIEENIAVVKEVAKQKTNFIEPASSWQLVRDQWEGEKKINCSVYKQDRYYGMEIAPVDITGKQQELPEKEQKFWDKEQEKEDKLKEQDEKYAEGDKLDPDQEFIEGTKPDVMAPASGDSELLLHTNHPDKININQEGQKVQAYEVLTNRLLFKNSPVCVASRRWEGMMNICYGFQDKEICHFASVYIGDGLERPSLNNFDVDTLPICPPMCQVPADILEEQDVNPEVEKEVFNRIGDAEQRDRDKIAKIRADREEERKIKEQKKFEKEQARLQQLEEQHEAEEEEHQEEERRKAEEEAQRKIAEEEAKKQKAEKLAKKKGMKSSRKTK